MSERPSPRRTGLRLGLSTLTVLPVGPGSRRLDRTAAATAMALAPLIGLAVGGVAAGIGLGLRALGAPPLVGAGLVLATGALLTRGLHLDGLADTVDGLGSYRAAPAALEIMRRPDVGAFGAAALVLVLLIQAGAVAQLLTRAWPPALFGIAAATAAGRLAIALACRRGVPAARPDGLGALVAGTVGPLALAAGAVPVAAVALLAVPGRPWQGPLGVLLSLAVAALLVRHARRRLGGITGDVLGAVCELGCLVSYVVASM